MRRLGEPRPATVVALPLVVVVAKFTGLYDRDELVLNKTTLDEAPAWHLSRAAE